MGEVPHLQERVSLVLNLGPPRDASLGGPRDRRGEAAVGNAHRRRKLTGVINCSGERGGEIRA